MDIPTEEQVAEVMAGIVMSPTTDDGHKIDAARVIVAYHRARAKAASYAVKTAKKDDPPRYPETEEEFAATPLGRAAMSLTENGKTIQGRATDVLAAFLEVDPGLGEALGRTTLGTDLARSGIGKWMHYNCAKMGNSRVFVIARKKADGVTETSAPARPIPTREEYDAYVAEYNAAEEAYQQACAAWRKASRETPKGEKGPDYPRTPPIIATSLLSETAWRAKAMEPPE